MRIPLTETGFSIIPEGWHIFKITAVEYKEAFGKLTVSMETKKGQKHQERYGFLKNDAPVEGAMKAFSYFAKVAMNDFSITDIDPQELVGHYIKGLVVHTQQESNREEGKMLTFANLDKKEAAPDGFDTPIDGEPEKPVAEPVKPVEETKPSDNGFNLNDFLNNL